MSDPESLHRHEHELTVIPSHSPPQRHESQESLDTPGGAMATASSASETAALSLDNEALNRKTVRKLDFILLPFLSLLFLLNSLDRSNIGNAETAHFTEDVGLEKGDLNTAVALFFIFFVSLQPVGAALGRRFGMPIWVPATMSLWGICTMLHVWVHAKWQLYTLRIVIGILEAGFYPTTVSYLSLFYTRYEFGRRLALFYGQYAVAGAFGGLLSYFVFSRFSDRNGEDGSIGANTDNAWESWQILFLLEGCGTVLVALIGFFWLPSSAGTAWFLSKDERKWADRRIQLDRDEDETTNGRKQINNESMMDEDEEALPDDRASESRGLLASTQSISRPQLLTDARGITLHDIFSSLLSFKIYHLLACNILSAVPVTSFSVFLPLVLKPFSPHAATANLLTVPPYVCGAITLYAFTYWSDRRRERLRPILISLLVLLAGLLAVTMMPETKGWGVPRYVALCVLLAGTFIASPLTVAWISGNTPAPGKRALMLGINGWGNLAGVFSAQIFSPRYAPSYHTSFWISALCVGVAAVGYVLFRITLVRENHVRRLWVETAEPEDVRREEMDGRGTIPEQKLLRFPSGIFGALRWRRGIEWVEEYKDDGREGDERLTFLYGL